MVIPTAVTAAAIAGGSSLLGSGASMLATGSMNKKTRWYNERMYGLQRKDAIADWNMQNSYNSPQAQMERFKAAGLNPNLIYGQTNQASPIRSVEAKGWNPEQPRFEGLANAGSQGLGAYYDTQVKQATLNNLAKQNDVLIEETALKQAQRLNINQQTAGSTFELGLKESLRSISLDMAAEQLRSTRSGTDINLERNAREALSNVQTLKEGMERILSMQLARAKTYTEIAQIKQLTENLRKDGIVKDLDVKLSRLNIRPSDPLAVRMATELLKPLQNNWESLKQNWFRGGKGYEWKGLKFPGSAH